MPQGRVTVGYHHVGQRNHHEGVSWPDMEVVWFHGKLKEKENRLVSLTCPAQLPQPSLWFPSTPVHHFPPFVP